VRVSYNRFCDAAQQEPSPTLMPSGSKCKSFTTVGTGTERSPADHPLWRRLVASRVQVNVCGVLWRELGLSVTRVTAV
jgi:hypothetical protein